MAYTNSPEVQTYKTEMIPAVYDFDLRPDSLYVSNGVISQDSGMVNLVPLKIKSTLSRELELHSITRQPITGTQVINSNVVNRGCYVWEKAIGTTYYFSVNGTGVYSSTDGISWTLVNTLLTNATTPVRFTEFLNDTNTKSLILVDGVEGFIFTSNAAGTKITSPDFPTPHVPWPVFLNGYLFLAKAATGDIYNSNLNDPSLWTAGDFLSSELYPDDIQALVKVNNYLLAVGVQGCEFFYDVANAIGSPLARYEGGSFPFGTMAPNSVAANKNYVIMLANTNDGEITFKYIEDFKAKDINPSFLTGVVSSRLDSLTNPITASSIRGYFFRQRGMLCYGFALEGDNVSPSLSNATFVFDLENQLWYEWRIGSNGEAPFPVYFTTMPTANSMTTYVSGHYNGSPFFGELKEKAAAQDVITNSLTATNIYTELRTPNLLFGTPNNKTMSRFGVEVTESTSSSATSGAPITLSVSWSDDDYATFTTPRNLVFGGAVKYPFITQLGQFRQRAFKLVYNGSSFLRYKSITMDINKGQQ